MAVLKNLVLAASLLAPLALAAPLLDERALHTHTEVVWVTVQETTTLWVDPTALAAATPTSAAPVEVVATTTTTTTPAPVEVAVTTSTQAPVEVAVPTTATTSDAPAAVFAQTSAAPSTFATVAAVSSEAAPAPSADSPSPAAPAASSTSAAAPAPQASAATVGVETKDVSASSSGTCEGQGDACVGDVTHWDGGLGACGWDVNTSSDLQIALPVGFMGSLSNSNPYCGRSVTLYNPTSGTTVQAKVGDKCMGCVDRAIDCTDALFSAITDGTGDGRVAGIQWWLD